MKDAKAYLLDDDNICLKDLKQIQTKCSSNQTTTEDMDDIPIDDQIIYSIDCKT